MTTYRQALRDITDGLDTEKINASQQNLKDYNMAYIGREPQIGNYQVCDAISVVNAQAAYTMQVSSVNVIPESVNHMIVSLNGVIQKPGSSYTISSSTITFSSNLATGDSIDFIYLLGNVLDLGTPSDDTVTGAKIVDNAINSEHYTDASIDLAHLSADSVDGSKIADNAINSEHYTDGSIDTAHIAADQITNAKIADDQIDSEHYVDGSIDLAHLAADSVNATKIADNAISEEHLDVTAVTGHTAETSIADGDLVLIHDASASALRKMTKANFVSGIGGANTPAFYAYMNAGQSIANETFVKIAFDTETFDVGGCYDTSNKRFVVPSGEAGKYVIMAKSAIDGIDDQEGISIALYKNGTRDDKTYMSDFSPYVNRLLYVEIVHVFDLSVGDYIEAFISHNEGEARSAENTYSFFKDTN